MSNNKPITVGEAARLFGFVAAAMVIVLLAISMEGEPAPVRPAWTLSEGLQDALLFLGLCVVAVGALLTYMGRVARRGVNRIVDTSAERLDTIEQRQQEQIEVLIQERNQMEKRVKEQIKALEWAADMHHKAMLSKQEELDELAESHQELLNTTKHMLSEIANQIPLDVTQALALMRYGRTVEKVTVGGVREFIRQQGIMVRNVDYPVLSQAVRDLSAPLPHQQAQPVRDAATEKKPANARRERANGRTRTHPRTPKKRST